MVAEIDWAVEDMRAEGAPLPIVTSIFFGGGTPSLMDPTTTAAIIERIKFHFECDDQLEITLEANPSSTEVARFKGFKDAGVNRLSLGIQALDDDVLKFLGRAHDHAEGLKAIETAAHVFDRYSFDLIYARPNQTVTAWQAELGDALSLAGEHLSLYQLTIESGTVFAREGVPSCEEDLGDEMFQLTQHMLNDAGRPAYEISNHALPGKECRHNLTYWRGGQYLGIGPGAHGRLYKTPAHGRLFKPGAHGLRYKTGADDRQKESEGWQAHYRIHNPARWLEVVEAKGHGTAKLTPLSSADRRDEFTMMGLRLTEGIHADNFKLATGLDLETAFDKQTMTRLVDGGFLVQDNHGLKATKEGLVRLNGVLAQLLI